MGRRNRSQRMRARRAGHRGTSPPCWHGIVADAEASAACTAAVRRPFRPT